MDGDNISGDGAEDGDDMDAKQEYVKKEYVARPYASESGAMEEVQESLIKNSRPRLRLRIARPRKEFGLDGFNYIDKDATE